MTASSSGTGSGSFLSATCSLQPSHACRLLGRCCLCPTMCMLKAVCQIGFARRWWCWTSFAGSLCCAVLHHLARRVQLRV